ncbi:MAG: HAMP domain-containing protein [Ardenticatenaceae bacterium]|nr:HAMP domain-containing protein [Ardenticatenaceae bacterium]
MNQIRQRLGRKLFFSYLIIILVGVVSLAVTAEFHAPSALDRHMASMETMIGGSMGGMMTDLTANFRTAVNEILLVAAGIATVTAVLVSSFVTRRIVSPVQQMKEASQRIANGRYDERVQVIGEDELADLAQSFNQMAHTLAQTEERRRQLIGDVAHELRTPLSSIKSVMEGLEDGVPAELATFQTFNEVGRLQTTGAPRPGRVVAAEAGQIPLELEAINPMVFIRAAAERLRMQFDDKGVALRLEIVEDLPLVQADAARMTQVLLNLLGNALQYTPSDGQVSVSAWASSNEVIITIQDTGIGIPVEHLRHIFERFYRVDKSRSRTGGGSGIGLTISKHLVEAHNGRLTAASPGHNQGSAFTITLPIAG